MSRDHYLQTKIHWWPTHLPERPLGVWRGQDHWELEAIHEPGLPLHFNLLINGRKEVELFTGWPATWTAEPESGSTASQAAEYEYELEKLEKNKDVRPIEEDELEDT